MITRQVAKQEAEVRPYIVWNAFVDLIATTNYRDLNAVQRPAHLVFWYESEVQNGGHLQYFENLGTEHLTETIDALHILGAVGQQQVLQEAAKVLQSRPRLPIQTVEEFCETALSGEFSVLDRRFHECLPSLVQCLQAYLNRHKSSFVVIA